MQALWYLTGHDYQLTLRPGGAFDKVPVLCRIDEGDPRHLGPWLGSKFF